MKILDFDQKRGGLGVFKDGMHIDKLNVIENRISEIVFDTYLLIINVFISDELINPYSFVR